MRPRHTGKTAKEEPQDDFETRARHRPVISTRQLLLGHRPRIHYRVVDEYDGETLDGRPTRTSTEPLKLVELVDFFLGAWDLLLCLDANFSESGYDRDEVKGFLVGAESSFYSQFGELIDARIDDWLDEVHEGLEQDEDEDQDEEENEAP